MFQNEERYGHRGTARPRNASSATKSAHFSDLLNAPTSRKTPLGTDTAWALKLKAAVDSAARELDVEVRSAKPICVFDSADPNDMLFELDTERGRVQATRSRSGEHSFKWVD